MPQPQHSTSASSDHAQDDDEPSAVDALIAKFQRAAKHSPGTTPEGFDGSQRKAKHESEQSVSNARKQTTNFRASLRSAVAIVKPRSVGAKVKNEKWWRRKGNDPTKASGLTVSATNPLAEAPNQTSDATTNAKPNPTVDEPSFASAFDHQWHLARALANDDSDEMLMRLRLLRPNELRVGEEQHPQSSDASLDPTVLHIDRYLRETLAQQSSGRSSSSSSHDGDNVDVASAVLVTAARFGFAACAAGLLGNEAGAVIADPALHDQLALHNASEYGHTNTVQLMLRDSRVDAAVLSNLAIGIASKNGHVGVVSMLLQDPEVDPSDNDNFAIKAASEHGQLGVVELLLTDKRVDPAASGGFSIGQASKNNHISVVKALLADARVDPSDDAQFAIQSASAQGNLEIVQLLLQDERVDPSAGNNYAIATAAQNGHAEVVQALLTDPRVDPCADDSHALRYACLNGHEAVVRALLADARVDACACDNGAIKFASEGGHANVVMLLLEDAQADPSAGRGYAVGLAGQNGHVQVLDQLMDDPRVNASDDDNYALKWASVNGHTDAVLRLLQDERVAVNIRRELGDDVDDSRSESNDGYTDTDDNDSDGYEREGTPLDNVPRERPMSLVDISSSPSASSQAIAAADPGVAERREQVRSHWARRFP